jgi:cytochrome c553
MGVSGREHPAMPDVVRRGRIAEGVRACGYCHYPNGLGRPENASIAGLPTEYFIQQVNDFKNGLRKTSEPNMRPPQLMADTAKKATDADIRTAAEADEAGRGQPDHTGYGRDCRIRELPFAGAIEGDDDRAPLTSSRARAGEPVVVVVVGANLKVGPYGCLEVQL